jgi:uncharacterized protein
MDILLGIVVACWEILREAAPYVLFGFLAAGLLKVFLLEAAIARHLGGNSTMAVLKASLLGIPLPLCSCGVIPAAIALRKQGAGKGPTAAFLISTPESGVDSIAITWALLDPIMTVVRPVAAFLTATFAGLLINRLPDETPVVSAALAAAVPAADSCGCSGSCAAAPPIRPSLGLRLKDGLAYAFGELLGDIGKWLLLGIGIAGVLSYLLPADFFNILGGEFSSLLIMLLVGIPLYICASASTPVAAAMVLKGLSPGAALVFLLAGPATNIATLTVITRFWGKKATAVYLAAIAFCSLLLGWLVNRLYVYTGADISRWVQGTGEEEPSLWATAAAVLLLVLIGRSLWQQYFGKASCGSGC